MDKQLMLAIFLLLALAGVVVYVVLTQPWATGRAALRSEEPICRDPSTPVVLLERRPSGGLAWSKAAYPEQYEASNLKTTRLEGLALTYRGNERYLDISGRAYSRTALGNFSYAGASGKTPEVVVEYLATAETFVGKIKGTGLKPNFAYQIKLRGRYRLDREAFEHIGYTGRWRLPGRGTNYKDAAYEAFPDKEEVESYLLFDFFVTDPKGNVDKEFYLDSTLHVLWNATVQRSPSPMDGCQIPAVRSGSNPGDYANPNADFSTHRIYAETEENSPSGDHQRPPIGHAFLSPGEYKAEMVLTEESFHGYGDAGFWATVMVGSIEFDVEDKLRPTPLAPPLNQVGNLLRLDQVDVSDISIAMQSAEYLEGVSEEGEPEIVFLKPLTFEKGPRYVFAFDVLAYNKHTVLVFVAGSAEDFERRPTYAIATEGRKDWQRFEIEITSMVEGRSIRLRLDPAAQEGPIGVRNAGIYKITDGLESTPRAPSP